jgi:hypothetical protein
MVETEQNLAPIPQDELSSLAGDVDIQTLVRDISIARFGQAETYESGNVSGFTMAISRAFDFRQGQERNQASELPDSDRFSARIHNLAERVGLAGDTIPQEPNAEAVLVLGGAGKSPLDRTAYTKELLDSGALKTDTVVLLGSSRPVDDAERSRGGAYAGKAHTEYELMQQAASEVFGTKFKDSEEFVGYDDQVPAGFESGWKVSYASASNGTNVFVLQSPMLKENRFYPDTIVMDKTTGVEKEKPGNRRARANTADTYDMFVKVAGLGEGSRVVAVTNAHFRPFQGADAVAELSNYGIETDVVGYDPTHFGNAPKKSEELLQETLSAVNSLNNVRQKVSSAIIAAATK